MSLIPYLLLFLADLGVHAEKPAEISQDALTQMASKALKRVEKMRDQKLTKPIKMGVKSKDEILKFIDLRFNEEYGPEKIEAESRLFKLQGLIPDDLDYAQFLGALMAEQVAGFYDHVRQELYIAQWIEPSIQEPVIAHELFHAIQVQEWGAQDYLDSKKFSQDTINAHASLLEGDATLVMLGYTAQIFGQTPSTIYKPAVLTLTANSFESQMLSKEFPITSSASPYLKATLIFPYKAGLSFLASLLDEGRKIESFRGLYQDPPTSTEQVLHPEKYLTRDVPSEVKFTKADSVFSEYKEAWADVAGEFHYQQMLMRNLPKKDAEQAAAGWDGDWTVLWHKNESQVAVSALTFDAEKDADEFENAIKRNFLDRSQLTLKLQKKGREVVFAISPNETLAEKALLQAVKTLKVSYK